MKKGLLLLIFTLTTLLLEAQPGHGGDPTDASGIPITGGILYLLLAGLGLGIKRFLKNKSKI